MASLQPITRSLFQIALGGVNLFVIKDNGLTLIDTGYSRSLEAIVNALYRGGESPDQIKQIVLTHAHPDHAGSAAALQRQLGVPVLAHQHEAALLEVGLSGQAPIHRSPGFINWLIYQAFIKRGANTVDPLVVDGHLNHGDVLAVAGGLQVLHTPGHSAGHLAFWLKQEGVMILGDTCQNLMGLALSTVYEDRALGIQSVLAIAQHNFDQAVFGHGRWIRKGASQKLKRAFSRLQNQT
ncbi:MBL fold metallo-hydrolase [Larkinella insperata]|uniref:MBL fold metallo-hydrolase n=1 Tax=Larkinella insperata TaxID=332158 RepID=A0ABW3QHX5_9BACT